MNESYPLTLLYDGSCSICRFEMAWLQRRDRQGRLQFVDFSAEGFDAQEWGSRRGIENFPTGAELDARIHAVTAEGQLVHGIEVFHRAYCAVGLGALAAPLGWRLSRPFAERAYHAFARNRYALSQRFGRLFDAITPDDPHGCDSGVCRAYRGGK